MRNIFMRAALGSLVALQISVLSAHVPFCGAQTCEAAVQDSIPASLADFLLNAGIDAPALKPVLPGLSGDMPQVFTAELPDAQCTVVAHPDGTGFVLLTAAGQPAGKQGMLITYDAAGDSFTILQRSPECIRQISATIQSLISAIYHCAIVPNTLACALDIIDLITNLYLLPIECGGETEERLME